MFLSKCTELADTARLPSQLLVSRLSLVDGSVDLLALMELFLHTASSCLVGKMVA